MPPIEADEPTFVEERLAAIRGRGRFRAPPTIEGAAGVQGRVEGRSATLFCSNDYLGLRADPRVIEAAASAARSWGAGSGSSRLIAGSLPVHRQLEELLADWMRTSAALVCSSGYQANLAVLQGLAGSQDRILSDSLNHASIIDGCRLSRAEVEVLPHGSLAALESALVAPTEGERFVVIEGLYSMDGDRAPVVPWAARIAEHGAHLLIDEAHAVGVMGPEGRGVCAEADPVLEPLARVGTFGKALGSHGAFVACSKATRELLVNSGRTYIFTTGLPPASAGAALESIKIIRSDEGAELRGRLARLARRLRAGIAGLDLQVLGDADAPIVPVVVGEEERAMALYRALLEEGVYAMAIRPPTVAPGTCRLRFTVSALHDDSMIDEALRAVEAALGRTG